MSSASESIERISAKHYWIVYAAVLATIIGWKLVEPLVV